MKKYGYEKWNERRTNNEKQTNVLVFTASLYSKKHTFTNFVA